MSESVSDPEGKVTEEMLSEALSRAQLAEQHAWNNKEDNNEDNSEVGAYSKGWVDESVVQVFPVV